MGIMKSRMIEEQARGWSSFDDKFACPECFDDPDIREFVQQSVSEHECTYCGKSSTEEPIAADMNEIMEFIMEGIQVEWGDPNDEGMSWESAEGGWLGTVLDSDKLFDEIGFYTANDELYRDICDAYGDRLWCQRNLYGLLPQQELFSDWKYFCYVVAYKTRFVFYNMQGDSGRYSVGQEPVPPHLILDTLGQLVRQMGLITAIPSGTEFFRARVPEKKEVCSTIGELGPPPSNLAGL